MDRKRVILEADRAEQLLNGTELTWQAVQADIYKLWANTKSEDADERERLYRELHGLRAVKARLQRMVNEGKKAKHEAERDEQRDNRRAG